MGGSGPSDLRLTLQIRRWRERVTGGVLDGSAITGKIRNSPKFTIFDVPGTIDEGTSTGSKREAWRTHQRRRNERIRTRVDGWLEMAVVNELRCQRDKISAQNWKRRERGLCDFRVALQNPLSAYGGSRVNEIVKPSLSDSGF
jgi:hypothetical protein